MPSLVEHSESVIYSTEKIIKETNNFEMPIKVLDQVEVENINMKRSSTINVHTEKGLGRGMRAKENSIWYGTEYCYAL